MKKLHPQLEMWLTVENWSGPNGTGRLLSKKRIKCHSYVGNFIGLLYVGMAQTTLNIPDTGNVLRTITPTQYNYRAVATAGDATFGVVVGTGTQANDVGAYALQTPIANGTGAGQLQYGAVSVTSPTTVGQKRQMTIARVFTNNSGASITVNEVGLVIYGNNGSTNYDFLVERTLNTNTIANGASATWTYTISITTS
jgi:hypothetical protein